jgi:hypothetical protein
MNGRIDLNTYGTQKSYTFAFIVGYTSGGAPYGLTHEEYDSLPKELT